MPMAIPSDEITVNANNQKYYSINNCIIEKTQPSVIFAGSKNSIIPSDGSITTIGTNAFHGSAIAEINIPEGVTAIKGDAFVSTPYLTSIILPKSLKSISYGAFGDSKFANETPISSVIYRGTAEDWAKVSIGGFNKLITDNITFAETSTTE